MSKTEYNPVDFYEHGPERRIELIDNRVIVGGSRDGSRALLWFLLESWGAQVGVALLDNPRLILTALDAAAQRGDWQEYELPIFNHRPWAAVGNLRQNLLMGLFGAAPNLEVYGRDIVMRLGADAHTPDAMIFRRDRVAMTEYYLDGAAEIVMEFVPFPDSERRVKKYLDGNVPELWLFDAAQKSLTVLTAKNAGWTTHFSGTTGAIESRAIPGISVVLPDVWGDNKWSSFAYRGEAIAAAQTAKATGTVWGTLPFAPRIGLDPAPISFDEFISWAPEAKFESDGKRLIVGSETGSRNVLAMLLMTFGLIEAVGLLAPAQWQQAVEQRLQEIVDADKRRR